MGLMPGKRHQQGVWYSGCGQHEMEYGNCRVKQSYGSGNEGSVVTLPPPCAAVAERDCPK